MSTTRRGFLGLLAGPATLKAACLTPAFSAGREMGEVFPASILIPPGRFPDQTSTGHLNAPNYPGELTAAETSTVSTNGETYRFQKFEGLTLTGSNNTFIGCRFMSNWTDGWNIIINDPAAGNTFISCTISPPEGVTIPNAAWPSAGAGVPGIDGFKGAAKYQISGTAGYQYGFRILSGGGTTIDRCDIWGFGNAIDLIGGSNTTITRTWIHDAAFESPKNYHTDGIGYLDGGAGPKNVRIQNCTIASLGNTNAIAFQVSSGYSDIVVDDCFLSGFGYTVDMGHNAPGNKGLRFTNNILSTVVRPGYGLLYMDFAEQFGASFPTNEWFGNRVDSGKFIHPDGTVSTEDWVDGKL